MQGVVAMVGCGALAGLVVGALTWRWPALSAPRISPRTVLEEAGRHPSLARVLWSRTGAKRLSEHALGATLLVAVAGGIAFGAVLWMVQSDKGLARSI